MLWVTSLPGAHCHSIDVCFDFPLFRVAVAMNTRKPEH